jgi:flagellar biosynthesis protein FlhG
MKYKIDVGQVVHLTTNSIFYKNVYESIIVNVSKDFFEISTPYYKGLHVPLNIGFILRLKINTPQGVCEFTSEVIDRDIINHSTRVRLPYAFFDPLYTDEEASCKFVTVASGKGGVGKTSFIINYAITLARKGKRVVLIDADLGMANIDVLLKISPKYNLIDVIDGSKNFEEVIIDAPGGIKLIPGGSGVQDLAYLTTPQFYRITSGFDYLEKNFDYVLIDTGAGLSKNITNFILSSDETIILTTPEPHAITDAYSIIKVILEKSKDLKLKLVINKCETPKEGEETLNRITGVVRSFLSFNILSTGYILENRVVTRSIKEQIPFCISYPTSDTARNIETIVEAEVGTSQKNAESGPVSGFVSKFKSLFGI